MATNVTLNGISYSVPSLGDSGWSVSLSAYLIAISTGVLQKGGGSFTLLNEVDFGSGHGLKTLYVKSRGSNVSATGIVRLANGEALSWRSSANTTDIPLSVDASDNLNYNGNPIVTLALGAANTVLRMKADGTGYEFAKIVNDNVDDSAGIVYSKLSLSNSIVNADIASAAAIAYSKLNLSGSIVNADVNASAAIARSKLAALTASRVVVTDGSGFDSASSVTATELGYVSGVTSSIQSQIDSKEPTISVLPTSKGGTGQNSTAVFPTSGTVVTRSAAEVLTNKDIDGGTASNANRITIPKASKSTLDGLTRKQATLVYASDQNRAYIDDGSILKEIGSGGGGGINYFQSSGVAYNFEDGLSTGWSTYADAAGASPVDGTGGAPSVTFAASNVTPQRGVFSAVLTKGAVNYQGQGVSAVVDIPVADRGKPLSFSFDTLTSANFVNGDAVVFAYDVTNSVLLPGLFAISQGQSTTRGWFLSSTTTAQIRFIIHVATTNVTAYTIKVDEFQFGVQAYIAGSSAQDWTTYSPTTSLTNTNISGRYSIQGDNLSIHVRLGFSGAPSGSFAFTYAQIIGNLPYTIKTNGTFSDTNFIAEGVWRATDAGVQNYGGVLYMDNGGAIGFVNANGTGVVTPTSPFTWGSGDHFTFDITFPISETSANSTLANRAVEEYAYNTGNVTAAGTTDSTNFGYGAVGTPVLAYNSNTASNSSTNFLVRFQTPIQPTDTIELEYSRGTSTWLTASTAGFAQITQDNSQYGSGVSRVSASTTDVLVSFGNKGASGYTASVYGGNGYSWSNVNSAGYYWRVRKTSGGASVGFPISIENIIDQRANSNKSGNAYKADVKGVANTHSMSIARPDYPTKVLVTVSFSYVYTNSNGTAMTSAAVINIKDGATTVASLGNNNLNVPSGFNNTINRTYSAIVDYPAATTFTIEAYELNTGGGSYTALASFLNVTTSAIKVGGY